MYCIHVCSCTIAIVVLYSVTGKEERLWPIVRLIINQSINQHESWGSYIENVIRMYITYYLLLFSKSNILQLHITALEK